MTNPTNMPEGVNTPALFAAPILTGSTRLPSVEIMTFADADAEVVALLASANSKRGKGEEAEREADFNVVVACELRDAILSTPPRTLADALAMLNRLACEESGVPAGMIPRQETAVVLLRDFMAALAAGKGVASTDTLCAGEPAKGVSNAHTLPTAPGPHTVATDAFRTGYDQLDKSYVGRPYDARYSERYRELLLQLDTALAAAGPVTSAADAAALVRFEDECFMAEHEGSEPTGLSAIRVSMMKGVAGFLATLAPVSSTGLPKAAPAMPTDPEAIGPNAVAVAAFWESYMGMDGLVMD
ncbi:hypothetical protein J2847_000453 [Azospirillum agricola]|uniref:hypothetical protein n=1 Tax=Azospirillum agricola TaxID=1720247 RepID=UPI001AE6FCDF|nr:hypothetical protein [Azospirillum agricola]MBP2227186.1 hypothetical protein [Azospirillum agricola]